MAAKTVGGNYYKYFESYLVIAVIYFVLCFVFDKIFKFIEKKGFQSSYTRRMGIKFFTGLIKLMTGKTITDPTSGLRMIGRNAMGLFAYDYPRDYPEPESVVAILRRNMKVEEIPVVMKAREGGVSSISLKKSVYYMIKVPLAILIERIRKY